MPSSQLGTILFMVEFPIGKEGVIPVNTTRDSRINQRVGEWLLVSGNTRAILADAIGITRPTLNNRLDGTTKWTWDEVTRLSSFLGVSLNELAGVEAIA